MKYLSDVLFDAILTYPDPDLQEQFSNLVGLDHEKERLLKESRILLCPDAVEEWSERHYGSIVPLTRAFKGRLALFLFAGDVGTGKTTLAESFPDLVARELDIPITLYRMSLGVRGQGAVGQMTSLITAVFERIEEEARKLASNGSNPRSAIVLLIDEADALAQSRDLSQMHHEDRAGVDALIRGIDRIGGGKHPLLVVICTNRLEAIDPAVLRRAADVFAFSRPSMEQTTAVLTAGLDGLGFEDLQIQTLAKILGDSRKRGYGCTYSDLTRRFLPGVLFHAFPDSPVKFENAEAYAQAFSPTPPFRNEE